MSEQPEKSKARETVEAFAVALVVALIIRTFVVQAFKIPSGSMIPTLKIGDHILVSKFAYWLSGPQRGDIVVFQYPRDKDKDFIKRTVGLPGETVEIKNQQVFINGHPLKDEHGVHLQKIFDKQYIPTRDNFGPVTVPEDCYFMMGDNRDSSMDSRYWGFLKKGLIKGKAFMIYFSINFTEDRHLDISKIIEDEKTLLQRIRWSRIGNILH